MKTKASLFLASLLVGLALTALSGLVGPRCKGVSPGGVSNGWRGLPIPFYHCGVWGDTFSRIRQCQEKNTDTRCSANEQIGFFVGAIVVDVAFWTGVVYLGMNIAEKKKRMASKE